MDDMESRKYEELRAVVKRLLQDYAVNKDEVQLIQSERLSKRKSDEEDLSHTLEDLNRALLQMGFPATKVYMSSWNMTNSSRNYFNDSLWKASYIVKNCIDNLDNVDGLIYSQLQDSVTDYYDNQELDYC